MDYQNVATTVFTPLEYGCVGLSEEEALKKFGEDRIKLYASNFIPLEWNYLDTHSNDSCYLNMLVDIEDEYRILGLHYLGPNAGEVIQGYAMAIKMKATKVDFDETVPIHPTCSEYLVSLRVLKGTDVEEGCTT